MNFLDCSGLENEPISKLLSLPTGIKGTVRVISSDPSNLIVIKNVEDTVVFPIRIVFY